MGKLHRDRLPDPITYFDGQGIQLTGNGPWRTGACRFHGGSDSLRVQVRSGAWCCMACHVKGGDVLSYEIQRHGRGFIEAARSLGAYETDDKPYLGPTRPSTLAARDALHLLANEVLVATVVIAGIKSGRIPSDEDSKRYIEAAARIDFLASEYRT
jgi:hypothetical protein